MKKLAILLALILALASMAVPAMAEGEIVLYHTATDDQMAFVVEAFNAAYPDIKVTTYRAAAEELGATMGMELMANNPQFDIYVGNENVAVALNEQYDPFLKWEPANLSNIKAELINDSGCMFPIGVGFYTIIYNTNMIDAADAPKSFADLLDEKYANKLVMADPASSGSIYNFLWFITQKMGETEGYGWDYLTKLAELDPMLVSSHGTLGETVSLGERAVGIQVLATAMTGVSRGDPIAVVYPEEGCPGDASIAAVAKDAKNAENAKLFLEFLLSDEGQKVSGANCWPPVSNTLADFTFADGTNPADVTVYSSDVNWVVNEKPATLEQFQSIFG